MNYNLKTFDTIKWLRNRYKARVKDKYILYESELNQQRMMKAVFNSIDRDKSKFLDRSELYDMFIKYGINITKQKLKEFFKSIDQDEDDKLNWTDFKQALQNQEALAMFKQLMLKIRQEYECDQQKSDTFVPLSFPQMIQYMNYCVLREETINKIESKEINNYQKHKQCVNLLTLEDSCYKHVKQEQSDDEEIPLQSDVAQLVQLKRYQEREQKFQRLEKVKQISYKRFYTNGQQNQTSNESERISDLSDMKANISQEINRTRSNIDNFLALINRFENKKPQSRQKSRGTPSMKKNTVLVEAQKEVDNFSPPPKFKVMRQNRINGNRMLSFKQSQN